MKKYLNYIMAAAWMFFVIGFMHDHVPHSIAVYTDRLFSFSLPSNVFYTLQSLTFCFLLVRE